MDEKDESSKIFNIITLGESGVGKTSIINQFINNKFDQIIHQLLELIIPKKKLLLIIKKRLF